MAGARGQHSSYIVKQLKHFKAGERQNALMSPMAMILADQDMEDLAAYFASQTLRPTGETEPSKLQLGSRSTVPASRRKACLRAAAATARTAAASRAPRSRRSRQHAVYAATQLRSYKSGARATDPNSMMRTIASRLTDEEIDAVASYLQGVR